jgi:hypothetical protein
MVAADPELPQALLVLLWQEAAVAQGAAIVQITHLFNRIQAALPVAEMVKLPTQDQLIQAVAAAVMKLVSMVRV